MGVAPLTFNSLKTKDEYKKVYPNGINTKYYLHSTTEIMNNLIPNSTSLLSSYQHILISLIIGIVIGVLLKFGLDNYSNTNKRKGYNEIIENNGNDIDHL